MTTPPTVPPPDRPACKRCGDQYPRTGTFWDAVGFHQEPIPAVPPFCSAGCKEASDREDPFLLAKNLVPGRLRHPEPHYQDDKLTVRVYQGSHGIPFSFDELPDLQGTVPPPLFEGQEMFYVELGLGGRPAYYYDLFATWRIAEPPLVPTPRPILTWRMRRYPQEDERHRLGRQVFKG